MLRHALKIGALEYIPAGRKLKSGRVSTHFFNSALFVTGEDANMLMNAYVAAVAEHEVLGKIASYGVYGPPYKGTLLVYGFITTHGGANVFFASSRKEAKDHGEGGTDLGGDLAGQDIIIIDDVTTSGDSLLDAARYIISRGGRVIGCVIAFDRQERYRDDTTESAAQRVERELGVPVVAAANLDNLMELLREEGQLVWLAHIERYREQYGA